MQLHYLVPKYQKKIINFLIKNKLILIHFYNKNLLNKHKQKCNFNKIKKKLKIQNKDFLKWKDKCFL